MFDGRVPDDDVSFLGAVFCAGIAIGTLLVGLVVGLIYLVRLS